MRARRNTSNLIISVPNMSHLTKAQASLQGAIDSLLRGCWWGPCGTAKEKESVDSLLSSLDPSPPPSPSSPPPPPPARPWCGEGGARVRRRTPGAGSTLSESNVRIDVVEKRQKEHEKSFRTWVVTVSLLWTEAEENCGGERCWLSGYRRGSSIYNTI